MSGQEGETGSGDPFQYLREGLKQDDDPERGRGIIGGLARLVQNNTVRLLQGGGVVTILQHGREEGAEEGGA